MCARSCSLVLAALTLTACGGGSSDDDVDPRVDARPSVDAAPACTDPTIALGVLREPAGAVRLYAHVLLDGTPAWFLVDTGSQHTFVARTDLPDGTPDAGVVTLGCTPRSVVGRPYALTERWDDEPILGTLGADYFLEANRELDLEGGQLVDVADDTHTTWPSLPFDAPIGYLFVSVELDGAPHRLGFDTGAAHTLWLRHPIEDTDQLVSTQDAYGNELTLGLGAVTLAAGTWGTREVPVVHAPTFPSLEDSNEAIGYPELAGLLGLTSLPGDRVRIDAARAAIYVAP